MIDPNAYDTDVIVIGAGLCGLTTAFYLHQAGKKVCLIDSAEQAGGVIRTVRAEGFTVEAGPNSFQSSARELIELCAALGLSPVAASPLAKKRYLYLNRHLQALPGGPLSLVMTPVLSVGAKLRLLQEPIHPKGPDRESVADFIRRRLGTELLEKLVGPFISGIYAGDPETLDIAATFPALKRWEQESGSVLKGLFNKMRQPKPGKKQPYRLLSFQQGMGELPQALASALPPENLRLGLSVQTLTRQQEGFTVSLSDQSLLRARQVVLATPAAAAAFLLESFSASGADTLRAIPYPALFSVHLGCLAEQLRHPLDGFGFLVPRTEGMKLLGSIWTSSLFPDRAPAGRVLLSSFIGGACEPEAKHWSESDALEAVLGDLRQVFDADFSSEFSQVFAYAQAIPQYTLGHGDRMTTLCQQLEAQGGPFLTGNYLQGVSLNDCVKQGRSVAEKVLNALERSAPT